MSKAAVKRSTEGVVEPEAMPAKVTARHVLRPIFDENSGRELLGKKGLKNETSWEKFLRLKRHVCKENCKDQRSEDLEINRALDRRDAGNAFVVAWLESETRTRDSLDMTPRGGGSVDIVVAKREKAARTLRSWRYHMGEVCNDWALVSHVCGEDFTPAQAVGNISAAYEDAANARFREALDVLVRAKGAAERCPVCRRGQRHGDVSRETMP